MRRFFPLLTLALLLLPTVVLAQDTKLDLDKTFAAANALLEKKKYAEALVEFRKIQAVEPNLEGVLRNGGMAAFFAGDYKTSLEFYQKLKATDLNDGFIRTRLIQVYQAMGEEKARDTERAELIALHNAGKDTSSLAKRKDFCRDQYSLGNRLVLVYEPFVFEPKTKEGQFAVRYQFIVANAEGQQELRVEAGWDAAQKDAKGIYQPDTTFGSFYFDAYYPTGPIARRTMGLFSKELTYNEAKKHVQAILDGKVKSTGSTPRKAGNPEAGR